MHSGGRTFMLSQLRFVLIAGLATTSMACVPRASAPRSLVPTKAPGAAVRSDIAGLARLIRLPIRPVAVSWQYTTIGNGEMGPSDARLLAVLQFSARDAAKVDALLRKQGTPTTGAVDLQSWFPPALASQAVPRGGQLVLRGQRFGADDFARQSLQNGSAFRIGKSPFLVLSLVTT